MRHKNSKKQLGRVSAKRKSLFKGMASDLILHGSLKSTEAKAKELKRYMERLIGHARKYDDKYTLRKYVEKYLTSAEAVDKLVGEIVSRYQDRAGGYVRVIKLGSRKGDGSLVCKVEFV